MGGAPGGEVSSTWSLEGGGVVQAVPGLLAELDATITLTYDDALALGTGELDPSVAFMQGRLKSSGDTGVVFELLAATAASGAVSGAGGFREHLAALIESD